MFKLSFNSILYYFDIKPAETILLRHADSKSSPGKDPYSLWKYDRAAFDLYQSIQSSRIVSRTKFSRPKFWATFVKTPDGETMFSGLYNSKFSNTLIKNMEAVNINGIFWEAGNYDQYKLIRHERLSPLEGEIIINWGTSYKSWVQRADGKNGNKEVIKPTISTAKYLPLELRDIIYKLQSTIPTNIPLT